MWNNQLLSWILCHGLYSWECSGDCKFAGQWFFYIKARSCYSCFCRETGSFTPQHDCRVYWCFLCPGEKRKQNRRNPEFTCTNWHELVETQPSVVLVWAWIGLARVDMSGICPLDMKIWILVDRIPKLRPHLLCVPCGSGGSWDRESTLPLNWHGTKCNCGWALLGSDTCVPGLSVPKQFWSMNVSRLYWQIWWFRPTITKWFHFT